MSDPKKPEQVRQDAFFSNTAPQAQVVRAPAWYIKQALDYQRATRGKEAVTEASFTAAMAWDAKDTRELFTGAMLIDDALAEKISTALGGKPSARTLARTEKAYRVGLAQGLESDCDPPPLNLGRVQVDPQDLR